MTIRFLLVGQSFGLQSERQWRDTVPTDDTTIILQDFEQQNYNEDVATLGQFFEEQVEDGVEIWIQNMDLFQPISDFSQFFGEEGEIDEQPYPDDEWLAWASDWVIPDSPTGPPPSDVDWSWDEDVTNDEMYLSLLDDTDAIQVDARQYYGEPEEAEDQPEDDYDWWLDTQPLVADAPQFFDVDWNWDEDVGDDWYDDQLYFDAPIVIASQPLDVAWNWDEDLGDIDPDISPVIPDWTTYDFTLYGGNVIYQNHFDTPAFSGSPKFGSHSYAQPGNGSLQINSFWQSSQWTLEGWANPNASSFVWLADNDSEAFGLYMQQINVRANSAGVIDQISIVDSVSSTAVIPVPPSSVGWHYIAVQNNAGTLTVYFDGDLLYSHSGFVFASDDTYIWSGSDGNVTPSGAVDEIRITNLVRYTAVAFYPPTGPFPDVIQPPELEWNWEEDVGDEWSEDRLYLDTVVVVTSQPAETDWDWSEDSGEEAWPEDRIQDVLAPVLQPLDVDWNWDEDQGDDYYIDPCNCWVDPVLWQDVDWPWDAELVEDAWDDQQALVNHTPAFNDEWGWEEDPGEESLPEDYVQPAPAQPYDLDWNWEEDVGEDLWPDEVLGASVPNIIPQIPDVDWNWDEDVGDEDATDELAYDSQIVPITEPQIPDVDWNWGEDDWEEYLQLEELSEPSLAIRGRVTLSTSPVYQVSLTTAVSTAGVSSQASSVKVTTS